MRTIVRISRRELHMNYEASGPSGRATETFCLELGSGNPMQRAARAKRFVTPELIMKSFNTRAYKRQQPDKPELMLEFISQAMQRQQLISFVSYWGKGLRPVLAAPEFACLDYLDSMMARIAEVYEPGAQLSLVFTDTHAALNGHTHESIHSYFQDLELAAGDHQFNTCLLSTLMNAPGLRHDNLPGQQIPNEDVLAELAVSAAKWFKGEGSAVEGAIRYFQANMIERKVMERAFPQSIFVTFNGSQLRSLFPDTLPIFYMFSLKHGVSDKPWFLPPDYPSRNAPPDSRIEIAQSA
jgi:hypothetical protein